MDALDRSIVAETARMMIDRINRSLMEDSPPGWKGTVGAMKRHGDVTNPYSLAWSMKNKGAKPHYKNDDSGDKKDIYKNESKMQTVDTIIYDDVT